MSGMFDLPDFLWRFSMWLQGNELGETLSRYANDLKLPRHTSSHSDLLPYADLMFWLKQSDSESFNKLVKVNLLVWSYIGIWPLSDFYM